MKRNVLAVAVAALLIPWTAGAQGQAGLFRHLDLDASRSQSSLPGRAPRL